MYSLLFLAGSSLALTLLLTPLVRNACRSLGMLDLPDHDRKLHAYSVPRLGGIAILVSYVSSFVLLLTLHFSGGAMVRAALPFVWRILPAAGLAFLTGMLDDIFGLKPWQKLSGQLTATLAAYLAGIHITAIGALQSTAAGGGTPWWSLPVTVLWLLACMNALNLIDGLDGLAAGIALFAATSTLLTALIQQNLGLALATLPLAGCLLGFLRYNFNPASIFLGDCGSLLIGLLLGCFAVLWSEKSVTLLGMAAPLIALSVPLLDTVVAIARRFLRKRSIFSADRAHVHHRLLDLGLSPREAALLLYGVCGLFAVLSLHLTNHHHELLMVLIFCGVAGLGIQQLHYVEFDTAGRLLVEGSFQDLVKAHISVQNVEAALALAQTPDECWAEVRKCCLEFGFAEAAMQLAGRKYREGADSSKARPRWGVEISLSEADYVRFAVRSGKKCDSYAVSKLADVLRASFQSKLPALIDVEQRATEDLWRLCEALGRRTFVEAGAEIQNVRHSGLSRAER